MQLALTVQSSNLIHDRTMEGNSQVVFLTNCFGFPSAPRVNYVSFKYVVPAEYSPLSGVYCVEIQHPPRSFFPFPRCTHVRLIIPPVW